VRRPPAVPRMAASYTINQQDRGFTECNITMSRSLVEPAGGAYCELPRRSVPPVEVLGAAARPCPWCPIRPFRWRAPGGGGPKEAFGTGLSLRVSRGPFPALPDGPVARSTGCRTSAMRGTVRANAARRPGPCLSAGPPAPAGAAFAAAQAARGPREARDNRAAPTSGATARRERSDHSRMACTAPRSLCHSAPSGMPTHCCRPARIGAGGTEHPGS
jgi:hypothetical protein